MKWWAGLPTIFAFKLRIPTKDSRKFPANLHPPLKHGYYGRNLDTAHATISTERGFCVAKLKRLPLLIVEASQTKTTPQRFIK